MTYFISSVDLTSSALRPIAAQAHHADAIGLSGLLVKSTLEMKYVIQDLERQKLEFPVICGGAALTRKYVEDDLRRGYANAVFYADDAFAGLHIMEDLKSENGAGFAVARGTHDEGICQGRGGRRGNWTGVCRKKPCGARCDGYSDTSVLGSAGAQGLRFARSLQI